MIIRNSQLIHTTPCSTYNKIYSNRYKTRQQFTWQYSEQWQSHKCYQDTLPPDKQSKINQITVRTKKKYHKTNTLPFQRTQNVKFRNCNTKRSKITNYTLRRITAQARKPRQVKKVSIFLGMYTRSTCCCLATCSLNLVACFLIASILDPSFPKTLPF